MFSPELLRPGGSQPRQRLIDVVWNRPYVWCAGIALLEWPQVSKLCGSERRNPLEISRLTHWHQECSSNPRQVIQFSLGNQTQNR